jgi:hypothetical protein
VRSSRLQKAAGLSDPGETGDEKRGGLTERLFLTPFTPLETDFGVISFSQCFWWSERTVMAAKFFIFK